MSNSVYQIITDRITSKIAEGNIPWQKSWTLETMPRNFESKRLYSGINAMILACNNYPLPYYLTFKQAKDKGGHVKRNEHGTAVVFWKLSDVVDLETGDPKRVPILRYYTIFNAAQIEGIEFPTPETFRHDPIGEASRIIENMPARPGLESGNRAAYFPARDTVMMPDKPFFRTAEDYYSVFFHELTHSTGHASRLNRPQSSLEGSRQGYAREELVAEMGAAFLCGESGIVERTIDQSAAYVQGWLIALRNDPKMLVIAAAQAQKAANYILNKKPE